MKKSLLALLLTALLVFSFSLSAQADDTIKIGYTAPFTGSAAEFGTNGWRGVEIALDEINAKGVKVGDKTYKVEIIRYDSICTPTDGAANVRKMAMQDSVVAVLGDHCSSVCNAIAPLCQEFKIPGLTIECASDNVTKPGHDYYFRMRASVGLMAPLFTPILVEKFKPKKAGFLVVNDDYGLGLASAVAENLTKAGVAVDKPEAFERGTTDFLIFLSKLKKAGRGPGFLRRIGFGRRHDPEAGRGTGSDQGHQVRGFRGNGRDGIVVPGRRPGRGRHLCRLPVGWSARGFCQDRQGPL